MIDRRTFTACLASALAVPRTSWAQAREKAAFYASVGPELTLYHIDVGAVALANPAESTQKANHYILPGETIVDTFPVTPALDERGLYSQSHDWSNVPRWPSYVKPRDRRTRRRPGRFHSGS